MMVMLVQFVLGFEDSPNKSIEVDQTGLNLITNLIDNGKKCVMSKHLDWERCSYAYSYGYRDSRAGYSTFLEDWLLSG